MPPSRSALPHCSIGSVSAIAANICPHSSPGARSNGSGSLAHSPSDPPTCCRTKRRRAWIRATTKAILALLGHLRDEFGLAIILITHEMEVVREIADSVARIDGGRIIESGSVDDVILDPTSSLARELLPDRPSVPFRGSGEVWEVSYASRDVPLDWLTSIHTVPGIAGSQVSVLSASVEAIRGVAVGRAMLAISPSAPAGFESYLKERGLHVTAVSAKIRRDGCMNLLAAGEDFSTPWGKVPDLLLPAYGQTWLMVGITMVLVLLIGTPVGIALHNTSDFGLFPNPKVFAVLNTIVNVGRSLPFLILMTAIIPVTRFLVGTTIGIAAAIVPMTTAGVPFFARLVQNALRDVRSDVTDMGQVSGGTNVQLIRTVQLSEALPALAGALTVNVIAMIEYSAIAGSIGAGGVGNLAITYGYNRFDHNIMIATVVVLIITVQVVQFAGDRLVKALTR